MYRELLGLLLAVVGLLNLLQIYSYTGEPPLPRELYTSWTTSAPLPTETFTEPFLSETPLEMPKSPQPKERNWHVIFSTDCSVYQDWQSQVLIHSHRMVGFPGKITRIRACKDQNAAAPNNTYSQYNVVTTPQFNPNKTIGDSYPPRNRPQSLSYLIERDETPFTDDELVFLVDPDQIFLSIPSPEIINQISPGHAVSSKYAQGTSYLNWAAQYCKECLIDTLSTSQRRRLAIGAPYILVGRDLKKIMPVWRDILEEIRADEMKGKKGGWISDMFAYSIASLKTGIDHERLGLTLSNVGDGGEPWGSVEGRVVGDPFLIHYCQKIQLPGGYAWSKHDYHQLRFDDCMKRPQTPLAQGEDQRFVVENGNKPLRSDRSNTRVRDWRNAWLYERVVPLVNQAFQAWHNEFCPVSAS